MSFRSGRTLIALISCSAAGFLLVQSSIQHLYHVLTYCGHEFPTMDRAGYWNIEVFAVGVGTDDKVLIWSHGIPVKSVSYLELKLRDVCSPAHSVRINL